MQEAKKSVEDLQDKLNQSLQRIDYDNLVGELVSQIKVSNEADFWQNQAKATKINKRIALLNSKIKPWQELLQEINDLQEIIDLEDENLLSEVEQQILILNKKLSAAQKSLTLNGKYDDHNAVLSIYAGTGGTDAQDWAEMLLRMYSRWAESQADFKVTTIDLSRGEEAGIKSVTLEIDGPFAYGKLKNESGIHRLVRLSPFNANNLRQTSFAKVDILPKIDEPSEAAIDEKELKIDVYRAGGHGGQSVNTTDSAVRVTHIPTGITVAIQNERSQLQNKEMAMAILRSRLVQLQLEQHKEKIEDIKGPNEQASWGNQIRSYVLHPYNMVKDLRTGTQTSDTQGVLNGKIDDFINANLQANISK
jgi:peptide chain release factor 2